MATRTLTLQVPKVTKTRAAAASDPLWYKDAIIYQAHVKSFFDSDNDGIGDFRGLTQKLDYLQGLGITCVWLLPFFPSPLRDDGYDIADYLNVHAYGTLDDFGRFVEAAHERGLKVLIELVVNHTSERHPWFQRARHAPAGSAERAFYVWSDTDQKYPETRIIFCDTEKSNWTFDPVAKQYYWHRFFSHQPDLNHNNPAVVDAVIDVMKFWLDLGVDALRLDAVPYLCVREGTTNENLPETHAVLRRVRRELDATYPNRMLLAEANQWPADVRPYFGEGDECHMAFHFPLMPRMFMALRQEDRHAITEILGQTPDIPDTCQWALFLRNHDELTLEMVTDEERDYMYRMYAADPQARLNLGIRRRLAPLLENSRRRIELMNSLLFSLPGTPVVYYGDEIGMGDNIYLGDRDGVRTPMQWNGERNGGFSRADPGRLFAPPITDPIYGYQAINVEAQQRAPYSLLQWMKRLITLRRQHGVFGRGSLDFVESPNRKVLSFLRRDANETVLVVANLARTVQPVDLDLSRFAGLVPIEMVGMTEFPRIERTPYFLTLGPHASYWFTLQEAPLKVAQSATRGTAPGDTATDSPPALMVGTDWQGLLDSATRTVLERQALAPFLKCQRWFASKAREIRQVRFTDWATLRRRTYPAFVTMVSASYTDGWIDTYLLPLATVSAEQAEACQKDRRESVLARISGARKGALIDGFLDQDVRDRVLQLIAEGTPLPTKLGTFRGQTWPNAATARIDIGGERRWREISGDQSNSLAFVNDQYALKLFRRIEPGINPDLELPRALAAHGFMRTPSIAGALTYEREGLEPGTMALVQTRVRHQGTGWEFALNDLSHYYERVSSQPQRSEEQHLEHWFLTNIATLGRRTAEMHGTLGAIGEPPFAAEPLDAASVAAIAEQIRARVDSTMNLLQRRSNTLGEPVRRQAERVLAAKPRLLEILQALTRIQSSAGSRVRIHGDYHLGQVLRYEEDFVILDFEGEPARPLVERRSKQPPLKDVAGMIRSFSYAAYAGLLAFTVHAPDRYEALTTWADGWQRWAADAFVDSYRTELRDSPLLPQADAWSALLNAFILDKALYELTYELNSRPDWVRVPLTGLLKLNLSGLCFAIFGRVDQNTDGSAESARDRGDTAMPKQQTQHAQQTTRGTERLQEPPNDGQPSSFSGATSMRFEPTDDDIRMRAYQRYLERGGREGAELDDWLDAEKELRKTR